VVGEQGNYGPMQGLLSMPVAVAVPVQLQASGVRPAIPNANGPNGAPPGIPIVNRTVKFYFSERNQRELIM
jgi:hypothetical protein